MSAVAQVPAELAPYLDELVSRLAAVAELDAVYLIGSAAQGTYEHGRSDVDVVAVTARSSPRSVREALATAAESLRCPARKLELVVYARGADRHELNVNTGELVHLDPDEDPGFWFVLDRAIAERHSVALLGPPWHETFAAVPPEAVEEALAAAAAYDGWDDPRAAEVAAARARVWRETGEWLPKAEAGGAS